MKRSVFFLLLCSSCVQRYTPPPVKTPSANCWKAPKEAETVRSSCPESEEVLADTSFRPWWKIFDDATLNELEVQAIQNSPTVQAAVARLEQAYAFYGVTRASLFPEIDLNLAASRERLSKTQNAGSAAAQASNPSSTFVQKGPGDDPVPPLCVICPPPPQPKVPKVKKPSLYANQLAILPTLNYELDFWGKNWQAAQSAQEQIKAEKEYVQTALLVLSTNVADTYLQVRTFDAELAILERTIVTRQSNYDINEKQYQAGLINKLPVDQAKSDLESAKASFEEVKRFRAIAEHALAELIGIPAPLFSLAKNERLPALPKIPAGVPAELLQNRPDIRQQEDLMNAAALNVGVAKTAYFPDFTITLDYGFMSNRANKLFKWKSHTWLTAADAVTPLFTAGRIGSSVNQAIAQYQQQVASYINTVLVSFQEVEDALYSVDTVRNELSYLNAQVAAASEAYQLADTRYRMGLENYIVVVDSERTKLQAERIATQVKRAEYSTTIALIKSLGGIWQQ